MLLLAQHPDQRRLLVERPELVPNAVEETLRFNPLNWSGCRTATQDIELGGQLIHQDDYVVMAYSSGNRDEDIWDHPDEFDITRSFDQDHQGFGYGEHSCPGRAAGPDQLRRSSWSSSWPGSRTGSWPARRCAGPTRSYRAWARLPLRFQP